MGMKLRFPLKGLNKGVPTVVELPEYTFDSSNVRAVDTLDDRWRGGQRPPAVLWGNGDQIGDAEQPVVEMCVIQSLR
jgi:hypothetical protein